MLIADIKERVDYLLREKDTTTPINQIIDGIKLGSINVVGCAFVTLQIYEYFLE